MSGTQFGVDWEQRVDFARLREERLAKVWRGIEQEELDALLVFKPANVRYIAAAKGVEGYWELGECCVVRPGEAPTVFLSPGIDPKAPWLDGRVRPARNLSGDGPGGADVVRAFVADAVDAAGVGRGGKLGVDLLNVGLARALADHGVELHDAGPSLTRARARKTADEIEVLKVAAAINDAGFAACRAAIEPGVRELDVSAAIIQRLRALGSDWYIRGVVCSGDHTHPQYKTVGGTDRILQPGDLVLADVSHPYLAYWSDVSRVYACGGVVTPAQRDVHLRCHSTLWAGIEAVRAGATTADVLARWEETRPPEEFDYASVGHGLGTTLHEPPVVSPAGGTTELEPGMVIALETYVGRDGNGVRLEENLIVTDDGYEILSKAPYEEALL